MRTENAEPTLRSTRGPNAIKELLAQDCRQRRTPKPAFGCSEPRELERELIVRVWELVLL